VVNTAWLAEQDEKASVPPLMVMFVVFTVEQFTFSDQLMVMLLFNATPVALFAGIVELTAGAVVSTMTVLGVANTAETLPAASFAHGYSVYVPPDTTVFGIRDTTTTQSTDPNFPDQYPVGPNNGARFPEGQEPQLFEFEFDDPAFLEVIGDTTIPGSDDIEDDVEMGALGTNPPDDFQPPEGPEQEIDDLITPPFEQEIEPEPEDEDNHYHDGYDGMGFGMGP